MLLYPANWKEIADELKKKHHYTCEICGKKFPRGTSIGVHHIDCNTMNNSEENLIVVCRPDHLRLQGMNLTTRKDIDEWVRWTKAQLVFPFVDEIDQEFNDAWNHVYKVPKTT